MAFGLDVTDLIYTDPDFVDQGTLTDEYEVDLDLAGSMDFELRVSDFVMEPESLWYVNGTEFGGIVDGFETDSDTNEIVYHGRSFRGIIASKLLYAKDGNRVVTYSGKLNNIINRMFATYGLDSMFVCEAPEEDPSVSTKLSKWELEPGWSVYDGMLDMGYELGYSYDFVYDNKQRKVHVYPVFPEDHTDYLSYCRDNSLKFKIRKNVAVTNHLVISGIDENAKGRTIHLFTNEGGEIQPYLKTGVTTPTKDSQYILDVSQRKLTGTKEIMDYLDANISAEENYEKVTAKAKPSDWDKHYDNYFKKVIRPSFGEEVIRTVGTKEYTISLPRWFYYGDYIVMQGDKRVNPTRTVKEKGKNVKKKNYWLTDYETVVIIDFDEDFVGEKIRIGTSRNTIKECSVPVSAQIIMQYSGKLSNLAVFYGDNILDSGADYYIEQRKRSKKIKFRHEYKGQKVSVYDVVDRQLSYEPLTPTVKDTYKILSSRPAGWNRVYSYFYTRSWDQDKREWSYQAASSTTKTDMKKLTRIKSNAAPADWKNNYDQYYYKFQTGTKIELRQYSSESKDKYVKLKHKPSDWDKNFASYFKFGKKDKNAKKNEYYTVPAVTKKVKNKKGKYVKKEVAPTFRKNKYYRRDSKTVIPKYRKNNCYLPATKVVAPTWKKNKYFSKTSVEVAPTYKSGVYFTVVLDHYRSMVAQGIQHLRQLKAEETQNLSITEYDLNIGDTVGGYDEITGTDVSQEVTNKIIKIKNGLVTAEYEIGGNQ